jgi:large subunit ribosomal protein L10
MENVRNKIKSLNANIKVIKNRLAIKYFDKKEVKVGRDVFKGPTAVAYGKESFIEVAKIITELEKEDKIKIKHGFIESNLVKKEEIIQVSKLPGKDQLMAQMALSIAMPLKKFGLALSAPLRNVLILMNNLKEKKEKEDTNNG